MEHESKKSATAGQNEDTDPQRQKLEIVPPESKGWLLIRTKNDSIIIGSGKDMVVITVKATTNTKLYIKAAGRKLVRRLKHLEPEELEKIQEYLPDVAIKELAKSDCSLHLKNARND